MGRLGIAYSDVATAAEQLKKQKLNPTVDAVRSALGTGSKSTIVPYLKRWRATQTAEDRYITTPEYSNHSGNPLLASPKFLALAKEMYEHLQSATEAEVIILKKDLNALKKDFCISENNRLALLQQKAELKTELRKLKYELTDSISKN